jgi:hypothetical protein
MLRHSPQVNLPINPQWVKAEYEKILTAFEIKPEFGIREDKPFRQFDLLKNSDGETGRIYKYFTTNCEENNKKLEGFIYPLKTSLSYSQELRNLEYAQNTIAINTKNYQAIREYMAELAATPLEVFQMFEEKDAVIFQAQISANLNYFKPGYVLLDTAISSIRGLVEVDQAERDRILQNQNQQLQDHVQAIGVGIAAGAIVASSSGLMLAEKITLPWEQNHGKDLHPFTIAVLLSSACAIAFWWLVFCGLKLRRNPANNNK